MGVAILQGNSLRQVVQIPVSQLHTLEEVGIDAGAIAQRPLNRVQVQSLVECKLENTPPLSIVETQLGYGVVDGYHRRAAAYKLELDEVDCIIGVYQSEAAVVDAAFRANLNHGLPANRLTRLQYVMWMFVHQPMLNDEQLAARSGVSVRSVRLARKAYEKMGEQTDDDETEPEQNEAKGLVNYINKYMLNDTIKHINETREEMMERRVNSILDYIASLKPKRRQEVTHSLEDMMDLVIALRAD